MKNALPRLHPWTLTACCVVLLLNSACFDPAVAAEAESSSGTTGGLAPVEATGLPDPSSGGETADATSSASDDSNTSTDGGTPGDTTSGPRGETGGETGSETGTGDTQTGTTTGSEVTCPAGVEGCPCGVGASCDGELHCSDDGQCLFPGMIAIPPGTFDMGCTILTDNQCQDDEYVQHAVDLQAYQIGRTEVSQSEYESCVTAGACEEPTANYTPATTPNWPVVRINWSMAQTYCEWQGGRLPTEAEWAKAARGTDSRKYPWGNAVVDCTLANYNACGGSPVDVDSYAAGASPYGALHMVGNVGEWVEDWYAAPFSDEAVSDPTGPASGETKVTRSQPFSYGNQDIRASFRSGWAPSLLSGGIGVRCARDLPAQP